MKKHPTLQQFSEHPCEHFEMRGATEWCVMFGKHLCDSGLQCNPRCVAYSPWDCDIEELLKEDSP